MVPLVLLLMQQLDSKSSSSAPASTHVFHLTRSPLSLFQVLSSELSATPAHVSYHHYISAVDRSGKSIWRKEEDLTTM